MKTNFFQSSLVTKTLSSARFWVFAAFFAFAQLAAHAAPQIWSTPKTTFTKADYADFNDPANWDIITGAVAITRQNNQGIYNVAAEGSFNKPTSPADTEWALGTTTDYLTLTFQPWHDFTAGNPPAMVGQDAVVHLISEDIYIDIKFTSWTSGSSGGGFSYERGAPYAISLNGAPSMHVFTGGVFDDPGAHVVLADGTEFDVYASPSLDTSILGIFELTYTYTHTDGSSRSVKRFVQVSDAAPRIWGGPITAFTKRYDTESWLARNQDRLHPKVWLTRDLFGGHLYNASPDPSDLEWAYGTTANYLALDFVPFRELFGSGGGGGGGNLAAAFSGGADGSIVNDNLVLHIISEDIYLDVKFSDYDSYEYGSDQFSLERTTPFSMVLNGDNPMRVPVGIPFVDPGATAETPEGAGLDVTVTGSVDTGVVGAYFVQYTATDTEGNSITLEREVRVTSPRVWTGPPVTFAKTYNTNPLNSRNQDRMVPGVWMSRRLSDGHLFNAAIESAYSYPGPGDTEWAFGNTSDPNFLDLQYLPFEDALNQGNIFSDMILHIISRDIYLNIRFHEYDTSYYGGDAMRYERATPFTFYLLGDNPVRLFVGDPFSDPGAVALDPSGNTLAFSVSGTVNPSVAGVYRLTYTASFEGDTIELVRTVRVLGEFDVAMMPSYAQNITYANAAVNEPLDVWGRIVGEGLPPYEFRLEFGDGSPDLTGVVSDPNFIGVPHVYGTAGPKIATLTVTDARGISKSRSAVISVFISPTKDNRINMAIEKGLLRLYLTQTRRDELTTDWGEPLTDHPLFAATAAGMIAFEENGHLPGNSYVEDIYAETVRMGLNSLLSCGSEEFIAVGLQPSGDPEISHNNRGAYFVNNSYANAHGVIALVLAHPSVADAQADIIQVGAFAGESFYNVGIDLLDLFSYCQGDDLDTDSDPNTSGNYRGGWSYTINHSGETRYDGSAQQWPALSYKAALDNWGVSPPAWVLANAVAGYQHLQNNPLRGSGYDSPDYWRNLAKTGGMLVSYALAGKTAGVGDIDVDDGLTFVGSYWFADMTTDSGADGGSWPGELYAMYAVKKGLQLLGLSTVTTPSGSRDWASDLSCWLLGDVTLDPALGESYRSLAHNFGQNPDGSWTQSQWPLNYPPTLVTAYGILVLTRSVTVALPVAIIDPVSAKPEDSSFSMSGGNSFHQDPTKHVEEYLWDFDSSDGVDFANPDATGEFPLNPGYENPGIYTVTLRVVDNSNPALLDDASINIEIRDNGFPPVAKAIPDGLLPAYAGRPGEVIQLDGRESYDPDPGGSIVLYEWDLDGDGALDDSTSPTPTFSRPNDYNGQVKLRVTDVTNEDNENNAFVKIYFSRKNLLVKSIVTPNVTPGVMAELNLVLKNESLTAGDYSNIRLKFYNGNPFLGGSQIGDTAFLNIPQGTELPYNITFNGLGAITTIYAYIDADDLIPEWNEIDNYKPVDVSRCIRFGDLNNDCCISAADVTVITAAIKAKSKDPKYDLNKDGKVDIADSRWLVTHYTNPGGAPCP